MSLFKNATLLVLVYFVIGCSPTIQAPAANSSSSGANSSETNSSDNSSQNNTTQGDATQSQNVNDTPQGQSVPSFVPNLFVAGTTNDSIVGTSAGGFDFFVRGYSSEGDIAYSIQFGSAGDEDLRNVAVTSDDRLLLVGETTGNILGDQNNGDSDAFIRVYTTEGRHVFTKQIHSSELDVAQEVAVDELSGDVVVAGVTYGNLSGGFEGTADVFLRRYQPDGVQVFARQIGSEGTESLAQIAVDAEGKIIVLGTTDGEVFQEGLESTADTDIFFRIYDVDGRVLRTRQFGTDSAERAVAINIDDIDDRFLIAGETSGSIREDSEAGGSDIFYRTYDYEGAKYLTRQFGSTDDDELVALQVNTLGSVMLAGNTSGSLWGTSSGGSDVFLRVYNDSGTVVFTKQIGTDQDESLVSLLVADDMTVYLVGNTTGSYVGTNSGQSDGFVHAYSADGTTLFRRQFGSELNDFIKSAELDDQGNLVILGETQGAILGTSRGETDLFMRIYNSEGALSLTRQIGTVGVERTPEINY